MSLSSNVEEKEGRKEGKKKKKEREREWVGKEKGRKERKKKKERWLPFAWAEGPLFFPGEYWHS